MKRDFFIDCVLYSGKGASVECNKFCLEKMQRKTKIFSMKNAVDIKICAKEKKKTTNGG